MRQAEDGRFAYRRMSHQHVLDIDRLIHSPPDFTRSLERSTISI